MRFALPHVTLILCLITTVTQAPMVAAQEQHAASLPSVLESVPDAPSPPDQQPVPAPAASTYSSGSSAFPSTGKRVKAYFYDLLGPGAFAGPAVTAGFDQARSLKVAYPPDGDSDPGLHPAHGAVPEWGEGLSGYSKRYASNFGIGLIGTSARYGLGEILREDVTYHPCACTGILPRATHALAQAFVAHTRSGRTVPSLPALASPYIGAETAVAAWYPSRFNAGDALRVSAPLYIGVPLKNLLTEFLRR